MVQVEKRNIWPTPEREDPQNESPSGLGIEGRIEIWSPWKEISGDVSTSG